MNRDLTRRSFLPGAAAAAVLPARVLHAQDGVKSPSDQLTIAAVGVGGVAVSYLNDLASENIAVLCDVDDSVAAKTYAKYPQARRYRDFRVMLEKEKGIDAVVVATPDHTHAAVARAALQLGKHVYCAKPMTNTIAEARELAKLAAANHLATQMSVQTCAGEPACATAEWVRAGAVGTVRDVHIWSDRPVWPQGMEKPQPVQPPPTLDWNLWLGPAPERAFSPVYHPFNWRGWVDFGTGALGDMACHALHVVYSALDLDAPVSVEASTNVVYVPAFGEDRDMSWIRGKKQKTPETFPHASMVTWNFPARDGRPAVRVHWYDGGLRPPRPVELARPQPWPASGMMFEGDKGVMLSGFTGGPRLLPESKHNDFTPPPKTLERSTGHYKEWVAAAKGGPPAKCEFGFASRLTETALLGVIAQRTAKYLEWDSAQMRFTNNSDANALVHPVYRQGWS